MTRWAEEHLKGVQAVLRYWGSPDYLHSAGLFHSIYGTGKTIQVSQFVFVVLVQLISRLPTVRLLRTEGFQGFSLPLSQRKVVRALIGERAEKLAFVFCMVDRASFDSTVFAWHETVPNDTTFRLRARPELGRFEMELNKEEWLDFTELTLADWLEQVEGASAKPNQFFLWEEGEAYSYRRLVCLKK